MECPRIYAIVHDRDPIGIHAEGDQLPPESLTYRNHAIGSGKRPEDLRSPQASPRKHVDVGSVNGHHNRPAAELREHHRREAIGIGPVRVNDIEGKPPGRAKERDEIEKTDRGEEDPPGKRHVSWMVEVKSLPHFPSRDLREPAPPPESPDGGKPGHRHDALDRASLFKKAKLLPDEDAEHRLHRVRKEMGDQKHIHPTPYALRPTAPPPLRRPD